jgi:pre-mRNA-splicing factor ATP-dependent RNA helicase DHX38/PRP16
MEENSELYRLEGSDSTETGGLIISKKKSSNHVFKKPQVSIFGLDKLAEQKRRENVEDSGKSKNSTDIHSAKDRRYRTYAEETPTYTGGVDKTAQEKLEARLRRQRLDKNTRNRDRDRDRRKDRDRDRDRNRDRDRERYGNSYRDRNRYGDSVRDRSSYRDWTPRFKDEPQTPKYRVKVVKIVFFFNTGGFTKFSS